MERERAGRPVVAIKGPWRPPDDWRSGGDEELERGKEKGRERVDGERGCGGQQWPLEDRGGPRMVRSSSLPSTRLKHGQLQSCYRPLRRRRSNHLGASTALHNYHQPLHPLSPSPLSFYFPFSEGGQSFQGLNSSLIAFNGLPNLSFPLFPFSLPRLRWCFISNVETIPVSRQHNSACSKPDGLANPNLTINNQFRSSKNHVNA